MAEVAQVAQAAQAAQAAEAAVLADCPGTGAELPDDQPETRSPLVWQLAAPSRRLDIRPCGDRGDRQPGRARAGNRVPADGLVRSRGRAQTAMRSPARPCVVMVSRASDAEAGKVSRLLAKVGVTCLRLDADGIADVKVLVDCAAGTLRVGETLVRPTVTWIRHFSARAVEVNTQGAAEVFARDSWQALVSQLGTVSGRLIPAHWPGPLEQLAVAARLGIRIPRTVVTTDPAVAKDEIPGSRLVVKSLAGHFVEARPGLLTGLFPEAVARRRLDAPGPLRGVPVIIQEYVEHDAELRAYYVRGQLHGFEVNKQSAADPWLCPERVAVGGLAVPDAVRQAIGRLAAGLRLEYAAFDFLLCGETVVFLEANLDGDWLWVEKKTGTSAVTISVARMLRDMHAECARRMPAVPGDAPGSLEGPLDLLRFLS